MEKMHVPSHHFFDLLVLELHQPPLLKECGHDDIAHVLKDHVEGYLSVKRTRQN